MITTREQQLRADDALARRKAQTEFVLPLVLEAGAGTGKTATLVARVLSWCTREGWDRAARVVARQNPAGATPERVAVQVLSRVVAITFTEAAAGDMARKIFDALTLVEQGEKLPPGLEDSSLPSDLEERKLRVLALLGAMDHLGVRTIHAFCARLLRAWPLEAGLHPEFIMDPDGTERDAIVELVVAERIRTAYVEPDPDYLALAEAGLGPGDVARALGRLVELAVPAEILEHDPLGADQICRLWEELRSAVKAFLRADGGRLALLKRAPKTMRVSAWIQALYPDLEGGGDSAEDLAAILQRDGAEEVIKKLGSWADGNVGKLESEALGGEAAVIAASARLYPLLKQLHALNPVRLQSGRRVLAPLLRAAQRRMRSRGIVSFSDLLMQTRDLLEQREDVRRVLRESIDQLLVDEFQDTDRIQCDIVRMLALEGDLRPGLFLVGDPKQSIYGWRSADLAAYEDFVARVQNAGGDRYYLRVNFRSVPAILEEVERVCVPIMPPIPGIQPPFEPLVCSEEKRGSIGFSEDPFAPVEHQVSWLWEEAPLSDIRGEDATALETRALARDLRCLHDRHHIPWNDMVLLMRSTSDVDDYAAALREEGIPYAVTRDRSYYQRREIIDASSLLRCILDPLDHVALVATLRSPLCGVPDGALIPLWTQRLPELMSELHLEDPVRLEQIEQRVRAAVTMVPTDIPGIERVKGWEEATLATLRCIAALRGSYGHEAPDVWVERLRGSLALEATEAARYQGLWRLANLDRFLRLLLLALEEGSGDEQEVLRSMRRNVADEKEAAEGKPMDAAEDVVRMMTVHKSKGLDFAHVYLLQHHKGGNNTRRPEVDVAWTQNGVEYVLFGTGTLGYPAVEARKQEVEAAERVRLLYVALTRAKQRIVTMGAWPSIQPRAFQSCKTIGELLANRPDIPELLDVMRQAATAGRSYGDVGAARWRFPALEELGAPEHSPPNELPEPLLPSLAEVAAAAARLSRADAEATARMKLPWVPDPASTTGPIPVALRPLLPPQRPDELWPLLCRQLRAILADWRPEEPGEEELRRLRPLLERRLFREVEPEELTASLRVTSVLLELFGQGPLPERLALLDATRGLPLIWSGEGAAGYHSDQVDILYSEEGTWILGFWSFGEGPTRGRPLDAARALCVQTEKVLGQPVQLESWSVLTGEVHRIP